MAAVLRCFPLLIVSLLGASCPGGAKEGAVRPAEPELPALGILSGRPSILLITADTLRRDHLHCYGYFRETSPRLDRLAEQGVLFERALASMASTYPSHLSLLTGLYPYQHGRTSNREGVRKPFRSVEGCTSVARVLAEVGYETAGFVSSTVLHARTGIGEGFDRFECPKPAQKPFKAARITDAFTRWLEERDGQRPFFAWLHYWDTHEPNNPPAPHRKLFQTDEALRSWLAKQGIQPQAVAERCGNEERVVEAFFEAVPVRSGARRRRRTRNVESGPYGADAVLDLWNRYDGDVHYVDSEIGRALDALDGRGLTDSTIVVFCADHGQSLGEDFSFGHGRITNVNTFVPLILRFPPDLGVPPLRIRSLVSLVDVMPTVLARLDLEGLDAFHSQVEGEDIFSGVFQRPFALTQESTQFHRGGEREATFGLLADRWKLIRRGEETELYDLEGAGESVDVEGLHPDVVRELSAHLDRLLRRVRVTAEGEAASPAEAAELLRNLEALGYGGEEEEPGG